MRPSLPIHLALAFGLAMAPPALAAASVSPRTPAQLDALLDFDHPERSEVAYRGLLAGAAAWPLADRVDLLARIARTEGLQGHFDAALGQLAAARKQLPDGEVPARVAVRLDLEEGRVFNSSKHPDQARPLFARAFARATEAGLDALAIDAAHMLGIVESGKASVGWGEKGLAIAEASHDPDAKHWVGPLTNNLGWTYDDMGEHEKALALFERCERFHEAQHSGKPLGIAKWTVAAELRTLKRYDEALAILKPLAVTYRERGWAEDGTLSEELAEDLLATGHAAEARPYFASAYAQLSKDPDLRKNEAPRLARLAHLAGLQAGDTRP